MDQAAFKQLRNEITEFSGMDEIPSVEARRYNIVERRFGLWRMTNES